MSTVELHAEHTVEADELREELERLQAAIASLSDALVEAQVGRDSAERKVASQRLLLDQAMALQVALRSRLHKLEAELDATRAELGRERTVAAIRAKLLADIAGSAFLARRRAIARAVGIEHLLG